MNERRDEKGNLLPPPLPMSEHFFDDEGDYPDEIEDDGHEGGW